MASDIKAGWCFICHERVSLTRRGLNNVLHLLLTIFTAGIWLIIWILAALVREPWHCSRCGSKRVAQGERRVANEERRWYEGR